ncbi:WxL domain-containing protein [Enterococcus sp. S53]|nr:WxL domain-containing protein [Enterococcus sp. S53]
MFVLSTMLLIMQIFFIPVSMVYADIKVDTEEQEPLILPSMYETMVDLESNKQEETIEGVPVEKMDSSDENRVNHEDVQLEKSTIDEEQVNNQSSEEANESENEFLQEKPVDEEEINKDSEKIESTIFNGETAEVATMTEFRTAIANPEISIISVQSDLTAYTANILSVNRPLYIKGNGHTLTFGNNSFYFQLEDIAEIGVLRIENVTLTKSGTIPMINATTENSRNWILELEDVTEVNVNAMRLATLPEGTIVFTGGVSNFTRTSSTETFIEAKEIVATNQAEVTINRGNATILFSSATTSNPKLTVEENASITISTTDGTANTIDFHGENPEIILQDSGELIINTIGPTSTTTPTDTSNNTIALTGISPKITISEKSRLFVESTLSKRAVHLAGSSPKFLLENSELTVVTMLQTAVNMSGDSSLFSAENSDIQLTSTTGSRMNLIGADPIVKMDNSQLRMNSSTGRGIYLQGGTPQVFLDNSHLELTDTGASEGIILDGTDALLSLSNQSELHLTGAGTGATENIQVGNNNARPELSVIDGSKMLVTTTSRITDANENSNNAISIKGESAVLKVLMNSVIDLTILSGARTGILITGSENSTEIASGSTMNINTATGRAYWTQGASSILSISGEGTEVLMQSDIRASEGNGAIVIQTPADIKEYGSMVVTDEARFTVKSRNASAMNITSLGFSFLVSNKAHLVVQSDVAQDDHATIRFLYNGGVDFTVTDYAEMSVSKNGGSAPLIRIPSGGNNFLVAEGGKIFLDNPGNGIPSNGNVAGGNQGIYYARGINDDGEENNFSVSGAESSIQIRAANGPTVDMHEYFKSYISITSGHFVALGNTADQTSGIFRAGDVDITLATPLYLDFRNIRPGGGQVFESSNQSKLKATSSDLALWKHGNDFLTEPEITIRSIDFIFEGSNFNNLLSTSDPDVLNEEIIGSSGLSTFSRISSNNARWGIVDYLHLPTNADKKIYGHVSVPEGVNGTRSAWDDEAIITAEVEYPSGYKDYFTVKTVGQSDEVPGLSIYGQEPRGGLFKIDLNEPLEAGSKIRISSVELTSGELTDGFEHQILTDTVEVFPIIPPTPAQFSSSIIAQDSTTIQGITDNLEAEVTVAHNGEFINTEMVIVDADGRFKIDLSEISLEIDDEIQVFLRDAEGSAQEAGVINPPVTNNDRGNVNPATELSFHDVNFEPATTLIVGDIGPVSPVDPLDPDAEIDPENRPDLPEDQGMLSIDFVSSFHFGTQTISVTDQVYYAQPQRVLNEDGTVNNGEERPNYVQVSDRRPENERNGWQLAVTQNTQFATDTGHSLLGAQLQVMNQQVVTAQGGNEPALQATTPLMLVPGNRRTLLRAEGTEGTGTWIYRFGDADTAKESIALHVPKGSNQHAANYKTTLTWELSAVPEN